MRRWWMIGALLLGGCVAIPLPHKEKVMRGSRPGLEVAAAKVMALEFPTRGDVVHEMGDPDASVEFGRVFIYRWTSTKMAVLMAAGAGYSGVATIEDWPINNFICFEFDAAGQVKRWERRKAPTAVRGEDYLLQLCRDW